MRIPDLYGVNMPDINYALAISDAIIKGKILGPFI